MTPFFAEPVDAQYETAITAPIDEQTAPAPTSPPPDDPRRGMSFKLAVGGSYGRFFTIPTYAGELFLAVGGHWKHEFAGVGAHLELGHTREGLPLWGLHPSAELEWLAGPVRVGVEGRLGYLAIKRVTEDEWLQGVSIGAAVTLGVDLVNSGSGAVYVEASGRADEYVDPLALSVNLSVGYRWDRATRL